MTKCVVLFSGGIDSLGALLWARDEYGPENVTALYCNVGQRYAPKELSAVITICMELSQTYKVSERLNLKDLELPPEKNAIIPYRNSFFILLAAAELPEEGGVIALQNLVVGETSTWDRRPEFNDAMSDLLQLADPRRVQLKVPWKMKTKSEIVNWIVNRGYENLLPHTIGCYNSERDNCGRCNSCLRGWIALRDNDLMEIIEERFDKDPSQWIDGLRYYIRRFKVGGYYTSEREQEFIRAIKKAGLEHLWHSVDVYAIDMDDTVCYTGEIPFGITVNNLQVKYHVAKPNIAIIERIRELHEQGHGITIHTARYPEDEFTTRKWLRDNGVPYDRLFLGKPRATHYVDDKNISFSDFCNIKSDEKG
jgi:7-cyano-7-deazaguanine synthase in queuosine biosynthesis